MAVVAIALDKCVGHFPTVVCFLLLWPINRFILFFQAAVEELRQVRIGLKDAEKGRERAIGAAEQAKHQFASAESGWRREAEGLRAALNEALTRNRGKDENASSEKAEVFQPSTATNWAQPSLSQQPQVAVTGPAMPHERPQPSTSGVSDATSQGLAQELMQKLMDETKQRRSTRQALSDKVKFFCR